MTNLQRIAIRGFRGLDSVDLELEGGGFLTGMNGAGKSSVLEAIRFALLGYCQNTDRRGAGAKGLIARGAAQAAIELELLGDRQPAAVRVRVVIPKEGAVRWNAEDTETGKPLAAKPEQLWPWMGVSEAALAAALMPAEHVTTQGFEGVLSELQAGAVETETLRELCDPARLEALLEDYPGNTTTTLNGLRTIGEEAYAGRREVGRTVKLLEAQIPSEPPEAPTRRDGSPLGTEDAAMLQKNIRDLSALRDKLMRELGEARQFAKVTPAGSLDELKAAIAAARATAQEADKAADEAQAEHRAALEAAEALGRHREAVRTSSEKTRRRIEEITLQMEAFQVGETCSQCGAKWTEPRVKAATGELRNSRMELSERLKNDEILERNLTADFEKARGAAATAEEAALEATNAAISAGSELAKVKQDLALAEKVAGVRTAEAVEAELLEVDERLDRAKTAMGRLALLAEYEAKTAELEKARARREELDWRVKAFRDGAILNALGADSLSDFSTAVDAALRPFGYSFALEVDGKTVKVFLGRQNEAPRPIERASSGERKLAEVAVAMTFADRTGIALIDDLDHLDGRNRNIALAAIAEAHTDGRTLQIVAAGAWGKPSEPENLEAMAKALAPLHVVWLAADAVKQAQAAA